MKVKPMTVSNGFTAAKNWIRPGPGAGRGRLVTKHVGLNNPSLDEPVRSHAREGYRA